MFQAPPRRDNVSPFEPEGSHGGLPLQGMRMGNPECGDSVPRSCSPEGATEKSLGFSAGISGAPRVSPVRDERE